MSCSSALPILAAPPSPILLLLSHVNNNNNNNNNERERGLGEIEILIVGSYSELIVLRERESRSE